MVKFILICATGRSGSTTLQRIVHTIPGANITGEKHGAIEDLLLCYSNIKKTEHFIKEKEYVSYNELIENKKNPCWYNSYNFEEVKQNIKNTILSILTNGDFRILGYKEIRWFDKIYLLDEFVELFPDTKIICHLSDDLNRQIKSGWWLDDINAFESLTEYNKQLITYASDNKKCYISYMKNLFDIDKIKELFLFLDEPFNENEYTNIINNNIE